MDKYKIADQFKLPIIFSLLYFLVAMFFSLLSGVPIITAMYRAIKLTLILFIGLYLMLKYIYSLVAKKAQDIIEEKERIAKERADLRQKEITAKKNIHNQFDSSFKDEDIEVDLDIDFDIKGVRDDSDSLTRREKAVVDFSKIGKDD